MNDYQIKNANIVSKNEDGEYKGLVKIKVSLDNGDAVTFFQPPDKVESFPKVKSNIDYYIKNAKYMTAGLESKNYFTSTESKDKSDIIEYGRDQSILRQVAFKGAVEIVCKGIPKPNEDEVKEIEYLTDAFHRILNQKNKQL